MPTLDHLTRYYQDWGDPLGATLAICLLLCAIAGCSLLFRHR